jgi:hypothetical protein
MHILRIKSMGKPPKIPESQVEIKLIPRTQKVIIMKTLKKIGRDYNYL